MSSVLEKVKNYWLEKEGLVRARLEEMGYLIEIKEIEGERRALLVSTDGKKQEPLPDNACFKLTPYQYMSALLRGMNEALISDALYDLKCLTEDDLRPLSIHSATRVERARDLLKGAEINSSILISDKDPRKTNKAIEADLRKNHELP